MELNNNQEIKHGGSREGAGRKKGSTNIPRIRDYLTDEQKDLMLTKAWELATAEKPDTFLLKFLLEQVHGKAPQSIDVTSNGEGFLTAGKLLVEIVNGHTTETKPDPATSI